MQLINGLEHETFKHHRVGQLCIKHMWTGLVKICEVYGGFLKQQSNNTINIMEKCKLFSIPLVLDFWSQLC